ncbi:small ribosomal subunit protein mS81 (rPPR8)-like [Bidens hawaiensis]|uniref:small ribosomal subunit protein mS81 (rPPR8)-like n=1 Tax=Bidens hawaiensis TaxID=980011 RepID=UPI00404B1E41
MRNQWRLLLQRCKPVSELQYNKVTSSSSTHYYYYYYPNRTSIPLIPTHNTHFHNPNFRRLFSSSSSPEPIITSTLIELYSDPIKTNEDVIQELNSKPDLGIDNHVIELFKTRGSPGSGKMFFDWVMSKETGDLRSNLSSNSCNRLLGMLGGNGLVKEFWDLVETMKTKGFGVKKGASVRTMVKFQEDGLEGDVEKLKDLFASGSVDASVDSVSSRACKVIRQGPWGDDVETKLRDMGVEFTSELVKSVLENLGTEVNKAVIFFRWVEESGLCKHDEVTYNAIAREVVREEYMDKFWRLIDEMRAKGFDIEKANYVKVLNKLVRKKMLKDAVELYAFAMSGNTKPSVQDCPFLLRKIVTSEKLDMDLFSKVLKIYKDGGNKLTNAALDSVLKSLTSFGRFNECNKILRAMEEVGFFPNENLQSKIGFHLSKNDETEEASKFLDFVEDSRTVPSYKMFGSLIEGYCLSGHLDKACDCFSKLIENGGSAYAGYALETLTNAYCSKNQSLDAYKLVLKVVNENEVKPWHTTYKLLISKLLDQGLFKEATDLFAPMKAHGYPPYVDPFVKYVSKTGTTDETVMFLKAMSCKKVPSTAVYLRVFKAYFKAGRHNDAQDFLSKCPRFIRNQVDVLTLFSSMKCGKDTNVRAHVAA